MENKTLLIEKISYIENDLKEYKSKYVLNTQLKNNEPQKKNLSQLGCSQLLSDVVKKKSQNKNELIILKQKNNTINAEKVTEVIKKNIDPIDLNIGVKKIKSLNDNKIGIICEKKADALSLIDAVQSKMGDNYEIKLLEKKNPRIKVVGIEEELDAERLMASLLNQNKHIFSDSIKPKIIKTFKGKIGFSTILEVHTPTYDKIINERILRIGWKMCPVYDNIDILRCYKCCGYFHKSGDCTNGMACGNCSSENHQTKDCTTNSVKCVNCEQANRKLNLQLDSNHKAFDRTCNIHIKKVEQVKNKYNYGNDK